MDDDLAYDRARRAPARSVQTATRAIAAALTLALHLLGGWIVLKPQLPDRPAAEAPPLLLLPSSASIARPPVRIALVSRARATLLPEPVSTAVRRLWDVPPPAAPAHGRTDAIDVGQLMRICGGARQRHSRVQERSPEVVLLIRVETDGRVSDIRTDAGTEDIDPAADHCLRKRAIFTPNLVAGAAVASWRVLRWPAESAGRDR